MNNRRSFLAALSALCVAPLSVLARPARVVPSPRVNPRSLMMTSQALDDLRHAGSCPGIYRAVVVGWGDVARGEHAVRRVATRPDGGREERGPELLVSGPSVPPCPINSIVVCDGRTILDAPSGYSPTAVDPAARRA